MTTAPDSGCHTAPDGACVSTGPCMHTTPPVGTGSVTGSVTFAGWPYSWSGTGEEARRAFRYRADAMAAADGAHRLDDHPQERFQSTDGTYTLTWHLGRAEGTPVPGITVTR